MCLYYSPTSTGNVRRKLNKNGKIVGYKLLQIWSNGILDSMYFGLPSPLYANKGLWKSGWIKSDRAKISKNKIDDGRSTTSSCPWTLCRGIHVYLKSSHAVQIRRLHIISTNGYILLPVTCYAEDFVGAGRGEAVFTKVFMEKADWTKYEEALKLYQIDQRRLYKGFTR